MGDYGNLSSILSAPEKCHICIIVMETKRQIELMYLSKAVSHYLTSGF